MLNNIMQSDATLEIKFESNLVAVASITLITLLLFYYLYLSSVTSTSEKNDNNAPENAGSNTTTNIRVQKSSSLYLILIVIFVVNLIYFGTNVQMNVMNELKSTAMSSNHPYHGNNASEYEFRDENCALLFFGVPRCFKETYLSIKKNILSINPNCDIYLHTYNISILPGNPRNQEKDTKVDVNQVYQLTNNVTMSTMDEFHKKHDVKHYRKFFPKHSGWTYPMSMDNMIKQWHSIESVWKYMESTSKSLYKLSNYYNKVGLFRIDQVYLNPINVSNGIAVKGDFHFDVKSLDKRMKCTDRLFYGYYNYSKVNDLLMSLKM